MNSVLFLSVMNDSAWGGSEELWHQSAIWMAENNYKVGVCCFNWPGKKDKLKKLRDAGCELYLLPGKKETKTIWGKWKLYNVLKAVPFIHYENLIVNQGGWKDIAYPPFKNLYKDLPAYSLTFHNYDTDTVLITKRNVTLKRWVNKAAINLGVSGKIFEVLKNNYSIDVPHQKILINPVTFELPGFAIPFIHRDDGKAIFSMLAALDTVRKAQDILITALSQDKWKKRNWELHLYGEGKDREMLEKLIINKQLQSKIFLKGYTDKVKQVISQSHLVLQVTHKDAMPISVMEAMAVGRPVLVSNTGDMPLWVKEGKNGWVTSGVDVQSIDQSLEKAWTEKENWPAMGRIAFESFYQRYPEDPLRLFLQQCQILKDNLAG